MSSGNINNSNSNRIKGGKIQIGNSVVLPIEQSNVTLQKVKVKKMLEETDSKAKEIIDGAENKSQIIVSTANTEAERIIGKTIFTNNLIEETIKKQIKTL